MWKLSLYEYKLSCVPLCSNSTEGSFSDDIVTAERSLTISAQRGISIFRNSFLSYVKRLKVCRKKF